MTRRASRGRGSMASGRRNGEGVRTDGRRTCGWCFIDGYMYTYYFRFRSCWRRESLYFLSFSLPWEEMGEILGMSGRSFGSLAGRRCAANREGRRKGFHNTAWDCAQLMVLASVFVAQGSRSSQQHTHQQSTQVQITSSNIMDRQAMLVTQLVSRCVNAISLRVPQLFRLRFSTANFL